MWQMIIIDTSPSGIMICSQRGIFLLELKVRLTYKAAVGPPDGYQKKSKKVIEATGFS